MHGIGKLGKLFKNSPVITDTLVKNFASAFGAKSFIIVIGDHPAQGGNDIFPAIVNYPAQRDNDNSLIVNYPGR